MNSLLGQSAGSQTQRQRLRHFQQALPKNLQRKDLTKGEATTPWHLPDIGADAFEQRNSSRR